MLLIATDEAGYGPKLGPLVICASVWRLDIPVSDTPNASELAKQFAPLRDPMKCGDASVFVDDSKAIYKPQGGLDALHAVISASHHWCGNHESTLGPMLSRIAARDIDAIDRSPWLRQLSETRFLDRSMTEGLRQHWTSTGLDLLGILTRVITAEQFNAACLAGSNKADLLSESTLGLVEQVLQSHATGPHTSVFCDRHGGRKFYGGVLQSVFPEFQLRVQREEKLESTYTLSDAGRQVDVSFKVKGDSFTPVALSSMHAKYLRERFMESFNQFFADRHHGDCKLKPTAGYPVDADRFLADVAETIKNEKIAHQSLVRSR